jgi:uncharacterized protein YbjT (DUF2867 family)
MMRELTIHPGNSGLDEGGIAMANILTVLVTGATGRQGGAVARLLLKKGHHVRAFTRKADSSAAEELKRLGAEIATGSFEDRTSVERAAKSSDAIFAMSTREAGADVETREGIIVADAAKAVGTTHLVYTSVGSADRRTGIPHFDSKYRVEQHIQSLEIPHTIIGPVFFMENLLGPAWLPRLQQGKLSMALPASRGLQQVAVDDIAGFAVLAMERREQFLGKRIDIASDEVSGSQAAEIVSRVSGRKIEYVEVPIAQLRAANEDYATMFEWFDRVGYSADIARLRREYPEVGWHTFEQWAKGQSWSVLKQAAAR